MRVLPAWTRKSVALIEAIITKVLRPLNKGVPLTEAIIAKYMSVLPAESKRSAPSNPLSKRSCSDNAAIFKISACPLWSHHIRDDRRQIVFKVTYIQ